MELCVRCGEQPIARSTWDGSSVPDEQAEPVETATPSRSSAMSSDSASTPSKLMLVVFGTRRPRSPLTTVPGTFSRIPVSSRSRRAAISAWPAPAAAFASLAAAPNPAMPGTFSVPARRLRSCPPPVWPAASRTPRRTHSAPTPLGPLSLCADSDSRSTPSSSTASGSLPADCTASVWNSAPRRRAAAASSATGCTVPISLLACMTETSTVSSVSAASSASGATMPLSATGTSDVFQPCRLNAFRVLSTASCSMALATMCRLRPGAAASATPRTARLSASVPPLVKTISWGRAPIRSATAARAPSTWALAAWPNTCTLEALPNCSRRTAVTVSRTAGASGVVAL